jgi:nicotinate-nucleotide adenylyltransferase
MNSSEKYSGILMQNKTGLLGGTFNPVHNGHIEIGRRIQEIFNLDQVLYILSANPPHKKDIVQTPARIRWEMLESALAPYPSLVPCDVEMKRAKPSWTIKTIKVLKKGLSGQSLYFISGSEGFLKIKTWKNYRQLFQSVFFIVLLRIPSHLQPIRDLLESEQIPCRSDAGSIPELPGVYIHSYESPQLQISSTRIRQRIRLNRSVAQLVPNEVIKIIERNDLYGS